jgi:hypothetical protein
MWIDERGSEVLDLAEYRRLLAIGAKQGRQGHLGISEEGGPLVLPVNYQVRGPDLMVRIGEGVFGHVEQAGQVSLEVDDGDSTPPWSVLVRGLAIEEAAPGAGADPPRPAVADAGHRFVRIRADRVTGRRLGSAPSQPA